MRVYRPSAKRKPPKSSEGNVKDAVGTVCGDLSIPMVLKRGSHGKGRHWEWKRTRVIGGIVLEMAKELEYERKTSALEMSTWQEE